MAAVGRCGERAKKEPDTYVSYGFTPRAVWQRFFHFRFLDNVLAAGIIGIILAPVLLLATNWPSMVGIVSVLFLLLHYGMKLKEERVAEGVEGLLATVEVRPRIVWREESRRTLHNHAYHAVDYELVLQKVVEELARE